MKRMFGGFGAAWEAVTRGRSDKSAASGMRDLSMGCRGEWGSVEDVSGFG
jgi:hypothetical protein